MACSGKSCGLKKGKKDKKNNKQDKAALKAARKAAGIPGKGKRALNAIGNALLGAGTGFVSGGIPGAVIGAGGSVAADVLANQAAKEAAAKQAGLNPDGTPINGPAGITGNPGGAPGTPGSSIPHGSPEQVSMRQMLMNQGYKGLEGLENPDLSGYENLLQFQNPENTFDFGPLAEEARHQFQTETIPSIAERFTALPGEGGQRSGRFAYTLGRAGSDLNRGLAALKAQYATQLQEQNRNYGLTQNQQRLQLQQLLQHDKQFAANTALAKLNTGLGQQYEQFYNQPQPGIKQQLLSNPQLIESALKLGGQGLGAAWNYFNQPGKSASSGVTAPKGQAPAINTSILGGGAPKGPSLIPQLQNNLTRQYSV